MAGKQVGGRAGAILSGKNGVVEVLGFGVYIGRAVPTEAVGMMAEVMREMGDDNPCIELDGGGVVAGVSAGGAPRTRSRR